MVALWPWWGLELFSDGVSRIHPTNITTVHPTSILTPYIGVRRHDLGFWGQRFRGIAALRAQKPSIRRFHCGAQANH